MRAATRSGGDHRNRHRTTVLATFRPTWRQILVHALVAGLVAVSVPLLAAAVLALVLARHRGTAGDPSGAGGPVDPAVVVALAGALSPLVALGSGVARWRACAYVNSTGVGTGGLRRPDFVPWDRVTDIRAERRHRRTVVVVYAADQVSRRLPAPYHGGPLAADPRFERKLFLIQHLWETHRCWGVPG